MWEKEEALSNMRERTKKGFTLAELLIVVAIIAVLVAISIPIFNSQLEKARKAVDMQNARNIESALMAAFTDGTIQVPGTVDQKGDGNGAWVTICRNSQSVPKDYGFMGSRTTFCGANKGITVNGNPSGEWNQYNDDIAKVLSEAGINVSNMKIKSNGKSDGWDWIIIEVGYNSNGFYSRMYSGFKGEASGVDRVGVTNIEKQIG